MTTILSMTIPGTVFCVAMCGLMWILRQRKLRAYRVAKYQILSRDNIAADIFGITAGAFALVALCLSVMSILLFALPT